MAGDWIPMRTDLGDDPAVIGIGCAIGIDETTVVGKLHRLWSWASWHTKNGVANGVTLDWIDRHVRCDGFAAAMVAVGWLSVTKTGVKFPKYDVWNSQNAKQRALTAKRVALHRGKNSNATTVTKTLPENRTVQDIKEQENSTGRPVANGWKRPNKKALGSTPMLMAWAESEAEKAGLPALTPDARIWLLAAAERALEVGNDPPRLFVRLVTDLVSGDSEKLTGTYRQRAETRFREWQG